MAIQPIGDVLAELIAARGFARVRGTAELAEAWGRAAGEIVANRSRPTQIKRGVLEVLVGNSAMIQELTYRKPALVAGLAKELPQAGIRDLRFRVGDCS